jgi:hypothetical protein
MHRSTAVNMPDALDLLRKLKETKPDGVDKVELYVISFAGKSRSRETKESLPRTCPDLFDGYYFTKSKENKKYVCEFLGVDAMIDDTIDVLENVREHYLGNIYLLEDKLTRQGNPMMPKLYLFTGDPYLRCRNLEPAARDPSYRGGVGERDAESLSIETLTSWKHAYDVNAK